MKRIYFDNNATTAVSDEVLNAMLPFFSQYYGNPSSLYPFGSKAKNAIEQARLSISSLINARQNEIILTSGGTESNCAAILSYTKAFPLKKHIICSPIEHYSIISLMHTLSKKGYTIDYLPVNKNGTVDITALPDLIKSDTLLVIVMLANNETGVVNDVQRIRDYFPPDQQICIHTDAVQAIGKMPVDICSLKVDSLSLSGHKFHAPKGVGALFFSKEIPFVPLLTGHQEQERRGGTENVPSVVGLGQASAETYRNLTTNIEKMQMLRDYFEKRISSFSEVLIIARDSPRLCNTTNFSVKGQDGTKLMFSLARKGICVSTGSACNSEDQDASYVLSAMGIHEDYIRSLRVSFNENNTYEEVDQFVDTLQKLIKY